MRLPWKRFLNYVLAWCYQYIEPEKREEWEFQLHAPLPGRERKRSDYDTEAEGAAFMALMAGQGTM